ncbi:hypothetical protein, partial [Heyndrickxia coagulans]|uniref:hypothetical protein n=1 Tax=Heyndrickxia coagulans TaxID=1398 RepID=UPI00214D69A7
MKHLLILVELFVRLPPLGVPPLSFAFSFHLFLFCLFSTLFLSFAGYGLALGYVGAHPLIFLRESRSYPSLYG